jgi:hypothetical protein
MEIGQNGIWAEGKLKSTLEEKGGIRKLGGTKIYPLLLRLRSQR